MVFNMWMYGRFRCCRPLGRQILRSGTRLTRLGIPVVILMVRKLPHTLINITDPFDFFIGQAYLAAVTASVVTALQGSIFLDRQIGLQLNGTGLVMYSALLNTSSTDAGLDFLEFLPNTPQLIQDILTNTSIGMMSQPFWNTTTLATIDTTSTVFSYDPGVLWAGYGACLGVAFVAIMIAVYSVWENGGSGDRSFALIVATTRSSTLDRLFKATARPEDIMDVPLRYGRLNSYQDSGSLGFGTSEGLDTTS